MKEFFIFLRKFLWKLTRLTGVPAAVRSQPVQFVWHSPPVRFGRDWLAVFASLGILAIGMVLPMTPFEKAKRLLVSRPKDFRSHLKLAEAAAKESDYVLAEKEFELALKHKNTTTQKQTEAERVLGLTSEFDKAKKVVFPGELIREEINKLEMILEEKPGYRDVLLKLSLDYWQVYDKDKAYEYFEKARKLDPNSETINKIGGLIAK